VVGKVVHRAKLCGDGGAMSSYQVMVEATLGQEEVVARCLYTWENGHWATLPRPANEGTTCGDKVTNQWAPFNSEIQRLK
jgi:hypothetical protein